MLLLNLHGLLHQLLQYIIPYPIPIPDYTTLISPAKVKIPCELNSWWTVLLTYLFSKPFLLTSYWIACIYSKLPCVFSRLLHSIPLLRIPPLPFLTDETKSWYIFTPDVTHPEWRCSRSSVVGLVAYAQWSQSTISLLLSSYLPAIVCVTYTKL